MAFCHNKKYEREFVKLMNCLKHTCFRIAGSGSASDAVCDCVLYMPEPCLVEVKATKENVFYMRAGIRSQLQLMIDICNKEGLIPVLAIKFKHRGWNIVRVNSFENIEFNKEMVIDENTRQIKGIDVGKS